MIISLLYIMLIGITLLAAACAVLPLWGTAWRSRRHPPGIFTGLLIIAFFFTAAFSLYQILGSAPLLPQITERDQYLRYSRRMEGELQRQIAASSQDPALWIQLGLAQIELARYDQTAAAFRKAVLLSDGDPKILLLYAKALTLQAGGVITPEAKTAFDMVTLQDPGNMEARFFLIMEQKQRGEEESAWRALTQLDQEMQASHPLKSTVQSALQDIRLK